MDMRKIIIIGVIIVVIAVVTVFMISSYGSDLGYTSLSIMGNGSIDENGTVDIKLTDWEGTALKNKDIHVSVKDSEGNVVFNDSSKTQVNGIASVKLINVSAGEYNINVTFEGDEKYGPSSLSERLIIGGVVEEVEEDNSTNNTVEDIINDILGNDPAQTNQNNPSGQYNGYNSHSGSSGWNGGNGGSNSGSGNNGGNGGGSDSGDSPSDGGGGSNNYDENGNSVDSGGSGDEGSSSEY